MLLTVMSGPGARVNRRQGGRKKIKRGGASSPRSGFCGIGVQNTHAEHKTPLDRDTFGSFIPRWLQKPGTCLPVFRNVFPVTNDSLSDIRPRYSTAVRK